ncbi:alpha/beta hydrolase family protein [Ornithinimicrobium sediminis]|uniref:alpha/beta hydrolase family protein n=1 Tax=Ornithinimicrobium sediminis TaxID=2904603 RepID=UPI001E4A6451|nr:alpha/beta hydrolase [Ornithinimicrobium sediminis]MCE0487834.1 alpha/beta hydrolase [Ornithinimicrobium sediminis]
MDAKAARAATTAAVAGMALGVVASLGSFGAATYFARRIITPEHEKKDDTTVVEVGDGTVTLVAEPHTLAPGHYGLWLDGGAGHARLGDVLAVDATSRRAAEHTVTREVLGVDAGELRVGTARWNGYLYCGDPMTAHGLAHEDVLVTSDIGDLPAWRVPPAADTDGDRTRWAVLVHGRSARREETLRALPVLHRLGYVSLVPMYRNDIGAPASIDGRYNLGLSEWRDIEAAIRYAVRHGAREVVLFGWSMGGAVVLQTLDRSPLAGWVRKVVLDGPVIDWGDVISHQADINRMPFGADVISKGLLGHPWARGLLGAAEPIDIGVTNWVARADELEHPVLLIHSVADDVVPSGPSQALARRRPDLVQLALWEQALHCREWNTDPQRWERLVADFLTTGAIRDDPPPTVSAGGSASSGRRRD